MASIVAAPSADRGSVSLQPAFFTSSLFVHPLRDDIRLLTHLFTEQYSAVAQPFALFRSLWAANGWPYLHFKVFDPRPRHSFLSVVFRIFLEWCVPTEPPPVRVAAFFGLYTFFKTQPTSFMPTIYTAAYIPISADLLSSLLELPQTLDTPFLASLLPSVTYLLSDLMLTHSPNGGPPFHILPNSALHPNSPPILPRELVIKDAQDPILASFSVSPATLSSSGIPLTLPKRGRGHPSKLEKRRKAREAIGLLDKWLEKSISAPFETTGQASGTEQPLTQPPNNTLTAYQQCKASLLQAVPAPSSAEHDALRVANEAVLRRVRQLDAEAAARGLEVGDEDAGVQTGLQRLERAMVEFGEGHNPYSVGSGILGLLDGAGLPREDATDDLT